MADNNERQEDDHQDKLNPQVPDEENHGDQQEDNSATANRTRLDSEIKKKTKIILKNPPLPPHPPLTSEAGGHGRQELITSSAGNIPFIPDFDAFNSAGNIPFLPDFKAFNYSLAGGSTFPDHPQYNLLDQLQLLKKHYGNLERTPFLNSSNNDVKKKMKQQQPLKKHTLQEIPRPPFFGGPSSVLCFLCNQRFPPSPLSLIWCPVTLRCWHTFCIECIQTYARRRIAEEGNLGWFECPVADCPTMIQPATFMEGIIPDEVVERWMRNSQEMDALANPTVIVCPFPDCGRSFLDDKRNFLIRACPHCWGVFCMDCRVSWHLGLTCKEFVRLAFGDYEPHPPL